MRVQFIDFLPQGGFIEFNKDPDLTLISLDPEVSYRLHKINVEFLEPQQISPHAELWDQYVKITKNSLDLVNLLDELLFRLDKRFERKGWQVFDALHYTLKIAYDQLVHRSDVIASTISKLRPEQIICDSTGRFELDTLGMFSSETCLTSELCWENQKKAFFQTTEFRPIDLSTYTLSRATFSFGQPAKNFLRSRLGQMLNETFDSMSLFKDNLGYSSKRSARVLSMGCRETHALNRKKLAKLGIELLNFRRVSGFARVGQKWSYEIPFELLVRSHPNYKYLTRWRGIDFGNTLFKVISFFATRMNDIYRISESTHKYLDKVSPDMIVLQTAAPFYLHNIPARWWCKSRSIDYAVWMHGGYGATYSLAGYDVVDFRLAPLNIAYGKVVQDLVEDTHCSLLPLGIKSKVEVGGSPFFDSIYGRKNGQLPTASKSKRRVTFCIGIYHVRNQFYFGYNRENVDSSLWEAYLEIIKVLIPYQEKYDITLKDYPGSARGSLWKSMLKDFGGNSIKYISNEVSYEEIVKRSDLNIFPWISTTFFQALYSNADIFALETGDLSTAAQRLLREEIFLHQSTRSFCDSLSSYLNKGIFFQRSKFASRRYFLDFDHLGQRNEQFASLVSKRRGIDMIRNEI